MTQVHVPSEYYEEAASTLVKFGVAFDRRSVLSVKWAKNTGQCLEGFIAANHIGGDMDGNFYIDERIPLSLRRTENEPVRVLVDGRVSIEIKVKDLQALHLFSGAPEEGASEIHNLRIVGL